MSDLTYDAPTTVDARGAPGHPEHPWADDDEETVLPDMILPRAFSINQIVLIWYCRDECWYEGKVVRSRSSGYYEVEFCAGGPRIRNWYQLTHGLIRPNTPSIREFIKAQGFAIVAKTSSTRR